jgi:putative ABC transport system permease protein
MAYCIYFSNAINAWLIQGAATRRKSKKESRMPEWKQKIRRRLAPLKLEPTRETAIIEELSQHLDDCYEELIARGATPAEAERCTLAELSERELLRRELRRVERRFPPDPIVLGTTRRKNMIADLWQDLRYGARMLIKQPGFALIVIVTLSLGIGANTSIFSVVNAVLLRPLPYDSAERLVSVYDSFPDFPRDGLSELEYISLRNESKSFAQLGVSNGAAFTLTGAGEPERVQGGVASANYFDLLGARMAAGRGFLPEEESAGRSNVVILSHDFWQRRFGGDPNAVGQSLTLNGSEFTIIGVLPAGFKSPLELQFNSRVEIWRGYGFNLSNPNRGSHGLNAVGRLRDGVTLQQVEAETKTIIGRVVRENAKFYPEEGKFGVHLAPLHKQIVGDAQTGLLVLLAAVGAVLLIACANVANLLLARSEVRASEIAVRTALGATRGRVVRQLLSESMLLSVIGGGAGILLARWGLAAIIALSPGNIPRLEEVGLDRRVLLFTTIVSLVTGILFGLAPALQATRSDLHAMLKEGGRAGGAQLRRGWLRKGLVVTETAMALLLLVGAGLLLRSLWHLQSVQTGFNPDRLLTLRLSPPASSYQNDQQAMGLYDRVTASLSALPGAQSVAVASSVPLGGNSDTVMQIEGRPFDADVAKLNTDFRRISPAYFGAIGQRLVSGRPFTDADHEGALKVAIINETLARRQWPNEDPLGKRLRLLDAPPDQATTQYMTVVGVAADAKNRGLSVGPRQEVYVPLRQQSVSLVGLRPSISLALIISTTGDPAQLINTVRQKVWAIDRNIPITQVRTIEQIIEGAFVQPRFNALLLAIFAFIALCLGAVGIYGVISYTVARRTHEIGIRLALGAQQRDVLRMIISQGMKLSLTGVAIGLLAALALTRWMETLLFGVRPTDPLTFAAIALALIVVALLACWIPARRAMKVDPLVALRCD